MSHRVTELYNITSIENVPSIMEYGILSHDRASVLEHIDISMNAVQQRRALKSVPNGLRLHQYANLYFCARNPMMYARLSRKHEICVLQISIEVGNMRGTVCTDQNAATDYVCFFSADNPVNGRIDFDLVFAISWNDADEREKARKKAIKCAEVLIPNCVEPRYIIGAYVYDEQAKEALKERGFNLPITINKDIFFG